MKTIQAGLVLLSLVGTLNASSFLPNMRWLQTSTNTSNQISGNNTGGTSGNNNSGIQNNTAPGDNSTGPIGNSGTDNSTSINNTSSGSSGLLISPAPSSLANSSVISNVTCPDFNSILANEGVSLDNLADFPCDIFFKESDLNLTGNFSQVIPALTQLLQYNDVGIQNIDAPLYNIADSAVNSTNMVDFNNSTVAALNGESQFPHYVNLNSQEYRLYLLENQNILMRKYMMELLNQHNDLMNYVDGIYKNQKLMLYWMEDQEQRL